jgi:hypothetical protein
MNMETAEFEKLYKIACAADDAFERAIKKQFGPTAGRWTVPASSFNLATIVAQNAKHDADDKLRQYLRNSRGD